MTAGDLENLGCRRHKPPLQKVSYFFLDPPFFGGTLAPAFGAFDSPMAIACLRLVAFFPDRPLFRVPRFRSCIASLTFVVPSCRIWPFLFPLVQNRCKAGSRATCQANGVNITLHIFKTGKRNHDSHDTAKFSDEFSFCGRSVTHADAADAPRLRRAAGSDAY